MLLQLAKHSANFIMTGQEHFIAYYRWRQVVNLFGLLLSPYSLTETFSAAQNCTFPCLTEMGWGCINLCVTSGVMVLESLRTL